MSFLKKIFIIISIIIKYFRHFFIKERGKKDLSKPIINDSNLIIDKSSEKINIILESTKSKKEPEIQDNLHKKDSEIAIQKTNDSEKQIQIKKEPQISVSSNSPNNINNVELTRKKHFKSIENIKEKGNTKKSNNLKQSSSFKIKPPFIEIDLLTLTISLLIPKQIIQSEKISKNSDNNYYFIELNDKIIKRDINLSKDNEFFIIEEEIEIEKPLLNFNIIYPEILENKKYSYNNANNKIYIFEIFNNSKGKLKITSTPYIKNPILPKKEFLFLLHDNINTDIQPQLSDYRFIWDNYTPYIYSLKNLDKIIFKDVKTDVEYIFSLIDELNLNGNVIKDNFLNISPLFMGSELIIELPKKLDNTENILIEIVDKFENKKSLDVKIEDMFFKLKLPEDLTLKYGEFKLEISDKINEYLLYSQYFRYIPLKNFEFKENYLFSNKLTNFIIRIIFFEDNWVIESINKDLIQKISNNEYEIILKSDSDYEDFYIYNKETVENKLLIRLSPPFIKWKLCFETEELKLKNPDKWVNNTINFPRENILTGINTNLIVRCNNYLNIYRIRASIKTSMETKQECNFINKSSDYYLNLNQFYDSFKKINGEIILSADFYGKNLKESIELLKINAREFICPQCNYKSFNEELFFNHIYETHENLIKEHLDYNELKEYYKNLPNNIYKCGYDCGFYCTEDKVQNATDIMSEHISKHCPNAKKEKFETIKIKFRVIRDIDEIRKNVIHDLPKIMKCIFCGKHLINMNKNEIRQHYYKKHFNDILNIKA